MKVAFLAPEYLHPRGGVGIYSRELVRHLAHKVELHVLTPASPEGKQRNQGMPDGVHLHTVGRGGGSFVYNLRFQLALLNRFNELHKRYNYDLVHAANLVHMPDIFMRLSGLPIPAVTTVHTTVQSQSHVRGDGKMLWRNLHPSEMMTNICYGYIRGMERMYLRRSKHLIAVSHWIRGFIKPDSMDIRVIHNGIDTGLFDGTKRLEVHGIPHERPLIVYTGRVLALKGIRTLIEAFNTVRAHHRAGLVIAGEGNAERWHRHLKGKARRSCHFIGQVPYSHIPSLYAMADIQVLPSFSESFPLSILEGMSSGTPVIASRVGGIAEMIEDGSDGILIPPGDINALVKALEELINDSDRRARIGAAAARKARREFDSSVMARKTLEHYEEVVGCAS